MLQQDIFHHMLWGNFQIIEAIQTIKEIVMLMVIDQVKELAMEMDKDLDLVILHITKTYHMESSMMATLVGMLTTFLQ